MTGRLMDARQNGSKNIAVSRRTIVRGIKREVARLREQLDASYRLTDAELVALRRVALLNILAERTARGALQGKCAVSDAVKTQGAASRARRDLSKIVVSKPELMQQLGRG